MVVTSYQSSTFDQLDPKKKQVFIARAYKEFYNKPFDQASINHIIKDLGIARGSVYRYFKDKTALWNYLKSEAEKRKGEWMQKLSSNDFSDDWELLQAQYRHGLDFQMAFPLQSRFLYWIHYQELDPKLKEYLPDWKEGAKSYFAHFLKQAKKNNQVRTDYDEDSAVELILAVHTHIAELGIDLFHHKDYTDLKHLDAVKKMSDNLINYLKLALQ
jgi:AcrR family transcriptional regulator